MPPTSSVLVSPIPAAGREAGPRWGGRALGVTFLDAGAVRLRSGAGPSLSEQTGLMDFGPGQPAAWRWEGRCWVAQARGVRVTVDESGGAIRCEGAGWSFASAGAGNACPFNFSLALADDEAIFGFGFQRTALNCRGHRLRWQRAYRSRSATVPFFFTSAGYGIFSNNTWAHTFDCGQADPARLRISADGGELDLFVIPGPSPRAILDGYTRLCGRPELPPPWALGLHYIARYFETQEGLLAIARRFREEGIPCDALGVEPGWEKNPYSMRWDWCPERFPDPAGMIRHLAALGFSFGLWESGDAPARDYLDGEVRRDWYARRVAASIALGVAFFKQDDPYPRMIHSTEMNEAEFNGLLENSGEHSAAEAGELSNALYAQTAHAEFERLTGGARALTIFHSYVTGPGGHRWPVAWAGDFPNGPGMLSAGLSGHSMVTVDMKAEGAAGIHFGYLTPYAMIDSWAFYQDPWLLPPHLLKMHRHYGRLRSRLRPYLYAALWDAMLTGVPLMRAMALEHPHDPDLRALSKQHYLGDWLLVGQSGFADGASDDERFIQDEAMARVQLPPGAWWDYWSGTPIEAEHRTFEFRATGIVGGPLLVKAGAIIPLGTCNPCHAESSAVLRRLDVFPGEQDSAANLYHDDGRARPLERGAWECAQVFVRPSSDQVQVAVGRFEGVRFSGPRVAWLLSLHLRRMPDSVRLDGRLLAAATSRDELLAGGGEPAFYWEAATATCWVRVQEGWSLRLVEDPEARDYDDFRWEGAGGALSRGGFDVTVGLGERAAAATPPRMPLAPAPDRLVVSANPPERVALEGGRWLPHKTTIWVTLHHGERPVARDGVEVKLVARENGAIIRAATAPTGRHGCVAFAGWDYRPGVTEFEACSAGLAPVVVRPGHAPAIRGALR